MGKFVLTCCSTADASEEFYRERDIHYVCFHYFLDGKPYMDDMEKTMKLKDFYQAMIDGAETKTAQVNADEYCEFFETFLAEGQDIVHVTLSSGISGSYNSACIAKEMMEEKYPDRKVYIVDSLCASSGFALLVDAISTLRDEGKTAEEAFQWAEAHKGEVNSWFFSTDLTFFIRGGRVSKTAGTIGGILGICPLLNVNDEGQLIPRANIRGKKKVIKEIVNKMVEWTVDGTEYSGKCYISHSECLEDAQAVKKLVEETFPNLAEPVSIFNIGTTIGSHTGPGTVALFFFGKARTK